MITRKRNYFFLIVLSVLFYSINIFSFTISPIRVYKKVKPGEQITGEYKIRNTEKRSVKVTIAKVQAADWLIFRDQEKIIKPGKIAVFKYKVKITEKDMSGEYKTELAVTQDVIKDENQKTAGAGYKTRMKVPFYILVDDTEKLDYDLMKLNFTGAFSKADQDLNGTITGNFAIKNSGNVHFMCENRLSIYKLNKDNSKEFVGEQKDDKNEMLFPGEEKAFKLEYQNKLQPGRYIVRIFCYFHFDDNLLITNIRTLKKEKCFNTSRIIKLDENGKFQIID